MNIITLIPVFNEEKSIGQVIKETKKYSDAILVIDDGSTDKTSQIASDNNVYLLKHLKNMGKGVALKSGFDYIRDLDYDIVVTIDGDNQHNPNEIPILIDAINNGADFVNGSRYINGSEENTPAYRRIGQQVLDIATNLTTGLKITDSQSGFRAFNKKACECFKFKDTGFGIESEMLADAAEANLIITEVPITVRYDVDGSTKNPVTHGVGVLIKVIKDKIRRTLF